MHFIPYHGLRNNINDWLIHTNVFYLKRWFAATMMRIRCAYFLLFSLPLTLSLSLSISEQISNRAQFSHFIRQFCHQSTFAIALLNLFTVIFVVSLSFVLSLSLSGSSSFPIRLWMHGRFVRRFIIVQFEFVISLFHRCSHAREIVEDIRYSISMMLN